MSEAMSQDEAVEPLSGIVYTWRPWPTVDIIANPDGYQQFAAASTEADEDEWVQRQMAALATERSQQLSVVGRFIAHVLGR